MILVAAGAAALAAEQAQPDWTATTERLERAVRDDDAAAIREARADLLRILAAGPARDHAPLVHYAIGYADWRLSTSPAIGRRERDQLLDDAERQLKAAVEIDPRFAEGFALLSGVYGMKIANSSIKGIVLGPRAGSALDRAMSLEPDNPRVLISQGVSLYNTPRMFGGNPAEAEKSLRAAIEKLAAQTPSKPFPAWGAFDAHVWLGQVLAYRGDKQGARAEYARALEVAPKSGWVRYVLLPALDKK
jgi:tetratricopeptide (TPR) repeat protein